MLIVYIFIYYIYVIYISVYIYIYMYAYMYIGVVYNIVYICMIYNKARNKSTLFWGHAPPSSPLDMSCHAPCLPKQTAL